jgi:aminoglycoside phosphotransferase (APT) family kinase protein
MADGTAGAIAGGAPDDDLAAGIAALGLVPAGTQLEFTRLTGGVSSDIWRVDGGGRTFCVKRALAKLRVAAEWYAPVGRNAAEVAYMATAAPLVPDRVPPVLAHDEARGLFAMPWYEPARHPLWKAELMAGRVDVAVARAVAATAAAIHAGTADRADVAATFANDANFHALRLEPYLVATAARHPEVAAMLHALVDVTAATKRALVHGDLSPKNILAGSSGPVLLDAECAWFGDPAFDLAFCLNHLLLKSVAVAPARAALAEAFAAFAGTYLAGVAWEDAAGLERRAARLLPGLFLARVDGKSPVEYLTRENEKDLVRRTALPLLRTPPDRLGAVADALRKELAR